MRERERSDHKSDLLRATHANDQGSQEREMVKASHDVREAHDDPIPEAHHVVLREQDPRSGLLGAKERGVAKPPFSSQLEHVEVVRARHLEELHSDRDACRDILERELPCDLKPFEIAAKAIHPRGPQINDLSKQWIGAVLIQAELIAASQVITNACSPTLKLRQIESAISVHIKDRQDLID